MPATAAAPTAGLTTYLILLVTTLIWGGTNIVAKLAVGMAPVVGLAAMRFGLAALCFAALLALVEPAAFRLHWRDLPLLIGLGLTGITGSNLLFFYGLSLAPVSDAALIAPATAPLWTAAFAALVLGERFSRRQVLGMVLSLFGVLSIVGAAGFDLTGGSSRLIGDLALLGGSGCWGLYSVLGRQALARHSALAASTLASLIGCLPMLLLAAPDGWEWLTAAPLSLWLYLLYLSVLGVVAAFLGWYRALRDLGAARAGQFTYLAPLWSLLLAALLLGDLPSPLQLAGAGLIIIGIWVTNRSSRRSPAGTGRYNR